MGLLAFGAICISFAPTLTKSLGEGTLGPNAIGFWRTLIGAILLYGAAIITKQNLRIPRPVMLWGTAAGLAFACDLACWHRSIFYASSGMATILGNTQVFGTAILSYFVFKEKLSIQFMIAAVSAIAGVTLLVGIGSNIEFTPVYIQGVIYGWMTGIFYALYIISLKSAGQHAQRISTVVLMGWASFCAAIFLAIMSPFESYPFMPPDMKSFAILIAIAIIAQSLGWWSISTSLPKVKGATSGLILLLQPVFATVWGWMLFAEVLTPLQLLGATITLAAIFVGSARKSG